MVELVLRRYILWTMFVVVLTWLYWPLLGGQVAAFRDAYHYYYPLAVWLDGQAAQGTWFPFFNPLDGTGTNLLGEATAGLFYPGRICWHLPGLDLPQRMGVLLMLHNLLAAAGGAYAAGRMRLCPTSQLLAAVAYGLSGPVFFQLNNPIFLIGAAWLPWALAECWALTQQGTKTDTPVAPVRWWLWIAATSLMLLGGDAQGSVHVGLLTLLAVVISQINQRRPRWLNLRRQLLPMAMAVAVVTGLTAMQWLPSWYWLQQTRVNSVIEHECYSGAALERDLVPELLRPTAINGAADGDQAPAADRAAQRGARYAFSVAPWHCLTMVWSTVAGRLLPERTRIFDTLAAEPKMWVPSLSVGLVTLLLAISATALPRQRLACRYWLLVVLLAGGAMLGNYAPIWLVRNALIWFGQVQWASRLPSDETLGLYWLLSEVVPLYGAFRYPAKWSVVFALAITMLAAQTMTHAGHHAAGVRRAGRIVLVISVLGWLGWCVVGAWPPLWQLLHLRLATVSPDPWLGGMQPTATWWQVHSALLLASLISVPVAYWPRHFRPTRQPIVWWLLVLVELSISAQGWLVTTPLVEPIGIESVDREPLGPVQPQPRRIWSAIGQADIVSDRQLPNASLRRGGMDKGQADNRFSGQERVRAICTYQQQFLLGKLHLLHDQLANLSAFTSLTPRALTSVRTQLAQHDRLRMHDPQLDAALAWLGVTERLVRVPHNSPSQAKRLAYQTVPIAAEPIQIVPRHSAVTRSSRSLLSIEDNLHVNQFGLHNKKFASHINKIAWSPAWQQESGRSSRWIVSVQCSEECDVIVRLFQDGGWQVRLSDQAGQDLTLTPQKSHLGLFQRFAIPPGNWQIELSYQPPGLGLGLCITCCTIAMLIGAIVIRPEFYRWLASAWSSLVGQRISMAIKPIKGTSPTTATPAS